MKKLLAIVEGEGDLKAVPELLRRILHHHQHFEVEVLAHKRGDLPKIHANFENVFKMAIKEDAAILLLIDFDCKDCDCVVKSAAPFYEKALALRPEWPFKVSFMVKEFETLFLADRDATRKILKDIPEVTAFPSSPESVRGAKEWLSKAMPSGIAYKETVHQVKIVSQLNLNHLRERSPSYRHLEKAVLALVSNETINR
ncbi:MAG: DUF4276 family protein [Gallionella sp.]|nr:DUF4276 family protein [Gallionella sp.]MDD4958559.1 DUF4276 family protein [Gallionella sp.]